MPLALADTIQDLIPDETVIYKHSRITTVTCRFIEYLDHGFTARVIALDGKKKGLEFLAWMDQISRPVQS